MLFLWDNGGCVRHQSDSSQRLETRGTKLMPLRHFRHRLPQFAAFLPVGPTDDEQGRVAAREKAGLARFLRRRM